VPLPLVFLAVDFLAVDFFAGDFFAGAFFAVLFEAGAREADFFAGAFLAVPEDREVDFLAVLVFFAGAFLAAPDFFAGAFLAAFFVADFLVAPEPEPSDDDEELLRRLLDADFLAVPLRDEERPPWSPDPSRREREPCEDPRELLDLRDERPRRSVELEADCLRDGSEEATARS